MGGSVELRSAAGRTIFMLVLPIASPDQGVDELGSGAISRENERVAAGRS
jgi:hypothetical protein